MLRPLRVIWVTAVTEWKILLRQRTFWLLAGLLFLIGWISFDHNTLNITSAISLAHSIAQGLSLFGSLLAAILGALRFSQEYRSDYDLLWSRPFPTPAYGLGKFLGVGAGFATALVPAALYMAYLEISLHGPGALLVMLRVWAILLIPTLLTVLAATWLLTVVIRKPLWVVLVMTGLIGAILAFNFDLSHLVNFVSFGAYHSPLIGFGPDHQLLRLHQLFYLEVPLLLLWLGLLLMHRLSPRQERNWAPTWTVTWSGGCLGVLALLIMTGTHFQAESDPLSVDPSADRAAAAADCTLIQDYQAEVTLRQAVARLEGHAQLRLQVEQSPVSLPLQLNDGLQVLGVAASLAEVSAQVVEDTVMLTFPADFASEDMTLTLTYMGEILTPRYVYDGIFDSPELSIAPYQAGAYLDEEAAFLAEDGNWHPFPNCPLDTLTVIWPDAPTQIVHTADNERSAPEGLTLHWDDPPRPLLASSPNYERTQIAGIELVTPPQDIPKAEVENVYSPYALLLSRLAVLLEEVPADAPEGRLVRVPLLKYDRYDSQTGVYWITGRNALRLLRDSVDSLTGAIYDPAQLYVRWTAETMIRTWWCRAQTCPVFQNQGYENSLADYTAEPVKMGQREEQPVLNALASYAALRLSEPLVDEGFVEQEIAARQRALDENMFWVQLRFPFASSSSVNEMMTRLDGLWEAAGPEAFWGLVQEYQHTYGTTSLSTTTFETFVEQVTGIPLP